ncbi:uracil-DNA glycosylase family protein [Kurthia sp. Dielmo]|uniref:uracil-DNA glycosylase family protein n=1 Tax=Kurthia sp. Dielmo TaxID=1033738 RepID=UPI00111FB03B|nr:uracil-DNA glycosylase family protein [Kurthia sp. Dielmo]
MGPIEKQILALVRKANPINPLGYAGEIVKDYARQKLDSNLATFHEQGAFPFHTVTRGPINADLLVINNGATDEQAQLNQSIVRSMEGTQAIVDVENVLDFVGFDRKNVFYIDAINRVTYREISGNIQVRNATQHEIKQARPIVANAIDIVKPKAILLLGAQANNMFNQSVALAKVKGEVRYYGNIPMMSVYHPDYFRHIKGKRSDQEIELLQKMFCDNVSKLIETAELSNNTHS